MLSSQSPASLSCFRRLRPWCSDLAQYPLVTQRVRNPLLAANTTARVRSSPSKKHSPPEKTTSCTDEYRVPSSIKRQISSRPIRWVSQGLLSKQQLAHIAVHLYVPRTVSVCGWM